MLVSFKIGSHLNETSIAPVGIPDRRNGVA
jgi:hypothetical protein